MRSPITDNNNNNDSNYYYYFSSHGVKTISTSVPLGTAQHVFNVQFMIMFVLFGVFLICDQEMTSQTAAYIAYYERNVYNHYTIIYNDLTLIDRTLSINTKELSSDVTQCLYFKQENTMITIKFL